LLQPTLIDYLVVVYVGVFVVRLALVADVVARNRLVAYTAAVLAGYVVLAAICRGRLETSRSARIAYHIAPVPAVLLIFFRLREIIPLLNPRDFDAALHRLDVLLVGGDASVWLEQFANQVTVEWFSFFYYLYFYLSAAYIFGMIFLCRDEQRLASFAASTVLLAAGGHFAYTAVPGLGPYAFLADQYRGPLPGGLFYNLVLVTVEKGGPLRDIFPSLHTAVPVYLTIFSIRHYPRLVVPVGFITCNIVIATLFLRYHYVTDVLTGLLWAGLVYLAGPMLVSRYQAQRQSAGLRLVVW
jgi:hypothetical protein